MTEKILTAASAFAIAASLFGCGEKAENKAEEGIVEKSGHMIVYNISRYDIPQYQWFAFDSDGNVLDRGITEEKPPEITENEDGVLTICDGELCKQIAPEQNMTSDWRSYEKAGDGHIIAFDETESFHFVDILKLYKDEESSESVNKDFFTNVDSVPVTNEEEAYKRASNELTGDDYNRVGFQYDERMEMWAVCFYDFGAAGGCTTVYVGTDGKTMLIISGE